MRNPEYYSNGAAIADGKVGGFKRHAEVGPRPPISANGQGQYFLVAKPINEIRAIIDRERKVADRAVSRQKYRYAIMYALRELRQDTGEPSAHRVGWNAAVEAAIDLVRKLE